MPNDIFDSSTKLQPVILNGKQRQTSEGRPVFMLSDGNFVTERSITVKHPDLNEGLFTNIPTVFDGRILSDDAAVNLILKAGGKDPVTGRGLKGFNSEGEAVTAAKLRSGGLGLDLFDAEVTPSDVGKSGNKINSTFNP